MPAKLSAIQTDYPVSKSLLVDILALAFIYFIPTLSHFSNMPLYLVEPMRIMIILAIAHTSRRNAFIIALTLPMFSFLVADHPVFYKTVIMTLELLVNIWLFYYLSTRWKNYFVAMLMSIVTSKVLYYVLKSGLIDLQLIESKLISTPIYIQGVLIILLSLYIFLVLSRKEIENKIVDPTREEF